MSDMTETHSASDSTSGRDEGGMSHPERRDASTKWPGRNVRQATGGRGTVWRPPRRLGPFEIGDCISRGDEGHVYLGFDRSLARHVTIKLLTSEVAGDADRVARFRAEAEAVARIRNPNVVAVHFVGEDAGCHFFAMTFVEGESLADRMTRSGHLTIEESLRIADDLLAGLQAAHDQGVIHRDVRPASILIESNEGRAILAGFGRSRASGKEGVRSKTGLILGNAEFLSPEQGGRGIVDRRSDLYSAGVVIYFMLTGRLPFVADSPAGMVFQHVYEQPAPLPDVRLDIPRILWNIVAKLLAKSPAARYSSATEVRSDLAAFRENRPLPSAMETVHRLGDSDKVGDRECTEPLSVVVEAPIFGDGTIEPDDASPDRNWIARLIDLLPGFGVQGQILSSENPGEVAQRLDQPVAECEHRLLLLDQLIEEAEDVRARLNERLRIGCDSSDELRTLISEQDDQLAKMRLQVRQAANRRSQLRDRRGRCEASISRLLHVSPQSVWWYVGSVVVAGGLVGGTWKLLGRHESALVPIESVSLQNQRSPTPSASAPDIFATERSDVPLIQSSLPDADYDHLAFSRNGDRLYTVAADGQILTFFAADGQKLSETNLHWDPGKTIATFRDGCFMARMTSQQEGDETPHVELTSLSPRQPARSRIDLAPMESIVGVEADRCRLLTIRAADGGSELLANADDGATVTLGRLPIAPSENQTLSGDRWLGFRDLDDHLSVYDLKTGERVPFPESVSVSTFLFRPESDVIAFAESGSDRLTLWELAQHRPVAELSHSGGQVLSAVMDRSGRRLAVVTSDLVCIWDLELRFLRKVIPVKNGHLLQFDSDGGRLAVIDENNVLSVWETAFPVVEADFDQWRNGLNEQRRKVFDQFHARRGVGDGIRAVTRDGRLALVIQKDGPAILEDAISRRILLEYPMKFSRAVAVSPDGRLAATAGREQNGDDDDVRLWLLRTGREVGRIVTDQRHTFSLAFSSDGRQLLSGGLRKVYLWNVDDGTLEKSFPVTIPYVNRVLFSDEVPWIVASDVAGPIHASIRRTVVLSATDGELLCSLKSSVPEWAFSPPELISDNRYGQWRRPGFESKEQENVR